MEDVAEKLVHAPPPAANALQFPIDEEGGRGSAGNTSVESGYVSDSDQPGPLIGGVHPKHSA
jgi:hypothetical protein